MGLEWVFSHDANTGITLVQAAEYVHFPDGHTGRPLVKQQMVPDPW